MPYGHAARRRPAQQHGSKVSPGGLPKTGPTPSAHVTAVVDLPKLGRQVMVFDAQRNLVSVNGQLVGAAA